MKVAVTALLFFIFNGIIAQGAYERDSIKFAQTEKKLDEKIWLWEKARESDSAHLSALSAVLAGLSLIIIVFLAGLAFLNFKTRSAMNKFIKNAKKKSKKSKRSMKNFLIEYNPIMEFYKNKVEGIKGAFGLIEEVENKIKEIDLPLYPELPKQKSKEEIMKILRDLVKLEVLNLNLNPKQQYLIGLSQFYYKNYEIAFKYFNESIKSEQLYIVSNLMAGISRQEMNDYEGSIFFFNEVLQKDVKFIRAYSYLTKADINLNAFQYSFDSTDLESLNEKELIKRIFYKIKNASRKTEISQELNKLERDEVIGLKPVFNKMFNLIRSQKGFIAYDASINVTLVKALIEEDQNHSINFEEIISNVDLKNHIIKNEKLQFDIS